jgi:hypothetical protein
LPGFAGKNAGLPGGAKERPFRTKRAKKRQRTPGVARGVAVGYINGLICLINSFFARMTRR